MKNFFLILLIVLLAWSVYFWYNQNQKYIKLQTNTWNLEKISQLEQQLSWLIEQFSWLQAENESLKQSLSWWNNNTTINQQKTEKSNVSTFSDSEIWISFSYPNNWWTITKSSETNNSKYLIMLSKNWNVFFAFHNWETPIARWSFWWDQAKNINSNSYINNFCQNKTNCSVLTNTNGIKYAKYNEEYWEMWSDIVNTRLMYYIFNPNSNYRGIIMSNERISNESISNLDSIINSLSFL